MATDPIYPSHVQGDDRGSSRIATGSSAGAGERNNVVVKIGLVGDAQVSVDVIHLM